MSTLAAEVGTLAAGLRGLRTRLLQIQRYLELVLVGQLPVNHDIMYQLQARSDCLSRGGECVHMLAGSTRQLHGLQPTLASMRMQDVFNLLPNLGVEALSRSFTVQSNDMMLAIYLASLTRSVLALHSLIDNKVPTWFTAPLAASWTQGLGEASITRTRESSIKVCWFVRQVLCLLRNSECGRRRRRLRLARKQKSLQLTAKLCQRAIRATGQQAPASQMLHRNEQVKCVKLLTMSHNMSNLLLCARSETIQCHWQRTIRPSPTSFRLYEKFAMHRLYCHSFAGLTGDGHRQLGCNATPTIVWALCGHMVKNAAFLCGDIEHRAATR